MISNKGCWQAVDGTWYSSGGFPLQISAIFSLFGQAKLVTLYGKPREGGIPLRKNVEVVLLKTPKGSGARRKLSIFLSLPYYLRTLIREIRAADVIHVPVPGDIPLMALLLSLYYRKPLIARYGSSWEGTPQTPWVNRMTKAILRKFAGGRNVMLTSGMGSIPPAPRMHWLFSTAISQQEIRQVKPNLDRPAGQPLHLAYAGRFSYEKGVITLLESLALLKDQRGITEKDIDLTLFGEGPLLKEFQDYVQQHQLREMVHFAGLVDRAQLTERMNTMDVLVMPSLTEGFPKARLDAMICGVPVITTEVGFGRESVGQNGERGWVIPRENPAALTDLLQRLLTEPQDWLGLRHRCRAFAEGFTLEKWAEEIGQICSDQWKLASLEGNIVV
ncbi:MAG TPA: glycosyltransferase [Anaerolineaceae bacterium]|nr:glycosyltransferase [Anaerolineaceae bacterium]